LTSQRSRYAVVRGQDVVCPEQQIIEASLILELPGSYGAKSGCLSTRSRSSGTNQVYCFWGAAALSFYSKSLGFCCNSGFSLHLSSPFRDTLWCLYAYSLRCSVCKICRKRQSLQTTLYQPPLKGLLRMVPLTEFLTQSKAY